MREKKKDMNGFPLSFIEPMKSQRTNSIIGELSVVKVNRKRNGLASQAKTSIK